MTKIRTGAAGAAGGSPYVLIQERVHVPIQVDQRVRAEVDLTEGPRRVHGVPPRAHQQPLARPPAAARAAKLAGVPISSSSYQPEMCSTGTTISPIRCW